MIMSTDTRKAFVEVHNTEMWVCGILIAIAGAMFAMNDWFASLLGVSSLTLSSFAIILCVFSIVFLSYSIRCSVCGLSLVWYALRKKEVGQWLAWLIEARECPRCGSGATAGCKLKKSAPSDR